MEEVSLTVYILTPYRLFDLDTSFTNAELREEDYRLT